MEMGGRRILRRSRPRLARGRAPPDRARPSDLPHQPARAMRRVASTFAPSHRGGSGPPLVCLHGFLDTWRTWQLVLPALERRHDVLAPTLGGHAGGPPIEGEI